MKTDAQLKKDVEDELAWDPAVRSTAIGVAVGDGIVTLTGHIETYAEKYAAEKALRRVTGVKALALELDVRLSPEHRRSDTDIAASARQALRWNTIVPGDKIGLTVEKGWVTLQGEVDWDYERRAAEKAIRPLMGVVGISNEVQIKVRTSPSGLQQSILAALQRQVEREVRNMDIRIDGTNVVLTGKVHSWHEREAAGGVAWAAPGVSGVVNKLSVA